MATEAFATLPDHLRGDHYNRLVRNLVSAAKRPERDRPQTYRVTRTRAGDTAKKTKRGSSLRTDAVNRGQIWAQQLRELALDLKTNEMFARWTQGGIRVVGSRRKDTTKKKGPSAAIGPPTGPSTAIVLGGGSIKGSFEVGALYFLKERQQEIPFGYVCGSSVGAINALALSAGGWNGVNRLVEMYLSSLRDPSSVYTYSVAMENVDTILRTEFGTTLSNILGGGAASELDAAQILGPLESWWLNALTMIPVAGWLIGAFVLSYTTSKLEYKLAVFEILTRILKSADSIYTLNPIEQLITSSINLNAVGFIPLRMAMTSLENGKIHYMDEKGDLLVGGALPSAPGYEETWFLQGTKQEKLTRGAIASASIPGAFPPCQLRVDPFTLGHFVDGGVREMVPITAGKELGAQRIIAIMTSPLDPEHLVIHDQPAASTTLGRTIDLLLNEVTRGDYSPSGGWSDGIERILLFPTILVHEGLVVDPALIAINIAYGYMCAHDFYKGQTGTFSANLGLGDIIFGWMAGIAITQLRMDVKKLEESSYDFSQGKVVFHKPKIDSIRKLKKQILDWTLLRFDLLGNDPEALPIALQGDGGTVLSIHSWWETWERHHLSWANFLQPYDLWQPLPVALDSNHNQILEMPALVPAKPTTNLF